MKKKLLLAIPAVILLGLLIFYFLFNNKPFYLDDQYYGQESLVNIDGEELSALEAKKGSFALLVYQPASCGRASVYDFNNYIDKFLEEEQMTFYQIIFSEIEDTKAGEKIKYCPSVVIYKKGKIAAYLDPKLGEHTDYYISTEGFASWFSEYVLFK